MTKEEFIKDKNKGRKELLIKILDTFKKLNPVAIHQFGSGARDNMDEFSDLDLWITFPDNQIDQIIADRVKVYESIAPILVRHEALRNSPIGGRYTLIIYETNQGLFHVDFYLAKKSNLVTMDYLDNDFKLLFGENNLPKGKWVTDQEAIDEDSLEIQINGLTFMLYIAVKGITRGWKNEFPDFIRQIYSDIEKLSKENLPDLPKEFNFKFIYSAFDNIYHLSNKKQQQAINKIRKYAKEVEELYT